jgi:hypothetical protein
MLPRLAAVIQDVGIVAARVFEGIGEDGQAVEGAFVIDGGGERNDGGGEPGKIDSYGAEGVADYVANDVALNLGLTENRFLPQFDRDGPK